MAVDPPQAASPPPGAVPRGLRLPAIAAVAATVLVCLLLAVCESISMHRENCHVETRRSITNCKSIHSDQFERLEY